MAFLSFFSVNIEIQIDGVAERRHYHEDGNPMKVRSRPDEAASETVDEAEALEAIDDDFSLPEVEA